MKRRPGIAARFVFALLAACMGPASAAALPPDLAGAAKDYDRANVDGDVATLARLFADDYVLVNSDASVENKQQAIADFRVQGFKIDPYVMTQPVEIAWDDGAVIGGVVELSWTQDGKHQQRRIRIAHVWAKRGGAWRMIYTQVTRVPQ
ncbi:MAG: nuclear transport factor 2 family protein [Rhodanobacteraceae bacterium]